jgi:YNFM family putative membrane transporter
VLAGLTLVGIGTFFAQATATGFVSRTAMSDRGSASGLYLASYFFGGLVGSAVLGQIFDRFGWAACVAGIGASLAVAALLASRLHSGGLSTRQSAGTSAPSPASNMIGVTQGARDQGEPLC